MPGEYAGHLPTDDPLHGYLSRDVLPGMGVTARQVDFRVFCLKETKVYRYEESHSRTQVVGKFFVNGSRHGSVAMERMRREFENLQVLRGYGLAGYPHHVVRPLGTNESLNSVLVEEYCGGAPLSAFIDAAIHQERRSQLSLSSPRWRIFWRPSTTERRTVTVWISVKIARTWTGW